MNQPKHQHALTFVFITMLIDVTGLGIIIPVIPSLLSGLLHTQDLSQIAEYGKWLLFVYAVMQFFCSPILGGLSDRFGRRPVILFSLFGFGLDYLLTAFAPTYAWLFIGRTIAGITGASFSAAGAYIADVSPPEKRAQNFGLIGAAFGIGFIIGPPLGGLLASWSGNDRLPFFLAAGMALANGLYGYWALPESLSVENRRAFDWKRANPVGSLYQLSKYPVILGLVFSLICLYVAGHATQSTWQYVTIAKFNWSKEDVGYSLGFVGLMVAIVQGLLTRKLVPWLGQKRAILVGFFFYAMGFTAFAFASQGWMMYAFMVPFALGGLAGPALQGVMSSQVPSNAQGELQGALTSLVSVTSVVGPLVMLSLFEYFSSKDAPVYFPGASFLLGALLTAVAGIFALSPLRKIS
jgi:MFS transporter, DHA1 family, tetracycline resistance protein